MLVETNVAILLLFKSVMCFLQLDVFDAADRYAQTKTPLIAIVGKEYGCGSSRDWAAKGPFLLVSAESLIYYSHLLAKPQ